VHRRGAATVAGSLRRLIERSSELAAERIRQINDGVYKSILFNDTIGSEKGLVRVPTTVVKEGGEMTILVQGVSPPNGMGPVHATWHLVRAAQAVYLFAYFFRGLMPNVGLFEPLTFLIEGPSVANSPEDVAHTEGTIIAAAVVQNFHVIGSKMLFDSPFRENVSAPFSRNMVALIFYGTNTYGYRATGITSTGNGAGQGARFDGDGEHSTGFYWASLTDAGEVEEFDARYPFTIIARGLLGTNYHGFGKYRGGSALIEVSMAYPNPVVMTSWGTSDVISHNPGIFGGYWGPPNPRLAITKTDALKRMAEGTLPELTHQSLAGEQKVGGEYTFESSSVNPKEFEVGDMFLCDTGSGGGYGDVLEREAESVMRDVREGMISADVATNIYKVVYNSETMGVDDQATEALRAEERQSRISRGKSFDDFIGGWLALKPKEQLLKYYGDWPDPRVPGYDKPFWGDH
jgi:N-methylhydantoinase B/oxoprolinase/acetone carboxylase alpha subunit